MAAANAVDCRLLGTDGAGTFIVEPSEVLYAETVDGRTFLYGRDRVLESPLRLYELEEALAGTEFVRASKSLIVNFDHVRALRPYLNARLELVLDNGESVIASRQYAPAIKQKIGRAVKSSPQKHHQERLSSAPASPSPSPWPSGARPAFAPSPGPSGHRHHALAARRRLGPVRPAEFWFTDGGHRAIDYPHASPGSA